MTLPAYEVRQKKCEGSPYISYTIYVGGVRIRSQLSPMSDQTVREHVAAYINPAPVREFNPNPPKAKPGRKPGGTKGPTVNARGFLWKDIDE